MSQALPKAPDDDVSEAWPNAWFAAPDAAPRPQAVPAAERPHVTLPATSADAPRSFLRMVSHELRTPLNAIIGFSEIISSEMCGPIPGQYREYGDIIRVSGHRLLRLVNQVLEIVKLESGQAELDPRAEPLDLLFSDARRGCLDDLAAKDMQVDVFLPDPIPAALADAKAVRMALVCLIQNAAAFGPEGGTVRLIGRVQGPLVQLSVSDDGEGLNPNDVDRLMRPFEQGDNALVRRAEGAGLGWPLVSLICRALGGAFEVRTAPGQGLEAIITLRRAS
jgi:signal transduction histidine kinase